MFKVNKLGKSKLQWHKVKDSGNKTAFSTGSQRDIQQNKGRFDLIPTVLLTRLAQHYENGAVKYGDNNWQKGQPLAQYYNSAMRHLLAIANADLEEDHFSALVWNVACMMHHIDNMLVGDLPIELDSFGIMEKIKEEQVFNELKEYFAPNTNTKQTYTRPQHTYLSSPEWTPTLLSGSMIGAPTLSSGSIPDQDTPWLGDKKVYDRDRFKQRIAKLDPEELG